MANEFERDGELGDTRRISPYQELPQEDAQMKYEDYEDSYEANGFEYDEEYEAYDEEVEEEESGGFLSTIVGKIAVAVIVLLLIAVIALLAVRFMMKSDDPVQLPQTSAVTATNAPVTQATSAPVSIVFAPQATEAPTKEPTKAPTQAPTKAPTQAPTAEPEPTATPLPIVLTNTATPSPSPTPTVTPSATPTPSPTPTVAPSAVPQIAKGEVNRDANLRETASAKGKVKQTVKAGEAVTIHEAVLDKDNKVWYGLTVDDLSVTGWMRDYVVNSKDKIASPTHTPKPTATPAPEKADTAASVKATEKPAVQATATPNPDAIGTGMTKKEANVRKVMNGKVLVQLKKNKRVDILSVKMDKSGNIWYEVKPHGSQTVGFVRDYLIMLDAGVSLVMPTAAPAAEPAPAAAKATAEPTAAPAVEEKKEESLLDREIIGKGITNRAANVRVTPVASGKLVRQLSKGNALLILEKYQDADGNIWYEVSTESGKTHGFVRDYVLNIDQIDKTREAKAYSDG